MIYIDRAAPVLQAQKDLLEMQKLKQQAAQEQGQSSLLDSLAGLTSSLPEAQGLISRLGGEDKIKLMALTGTGGVKI